MSDVIDLQDVCRATLQMLSDSFRGKEISAEFYPYIGLTHTIRRRGATWVIRISDHCRFAPAPILEAIVTLLACKVLRRKPPPRALEDYERYRRDSDVEAEVRMRRLQRGRKQISDVRGRYHSLAAIYRDLNRSYFHDQVEVRKLGWGTRRSWGRLGHYDPVHNTITISPVLDSPKVPTSVLSYLLYLEMLHTLFGETSTKMRKQHHTREFQGAERAFPGYAAARRFLDRFCRTRGKELV